MTRRPMIVLAWLALFALQGCAETTEPQISSGSNWLTCEAVDDCDDGRAVRCSDDGYCLDQDGDRIAAAGPDASIDAPSQPFVPPESMPNTEPGPPDASAPIILDGGSALVAPPSAGDASVAMHACDLGGARDPLVPRNDETCYDFRVHGQSSSTDTSPFTISPGESYDHFYYAVPWPAGSVATRYGAVDDSSLSVHAWLFSIATSTAPGTVSANVTGSLIGENARMLGAWATGGCNVQLPGDVGLELPDTGNLVVQWHHLNETGSAQDDSSVFTVCTVPATERPQLAGLTILGTENINAPPGSSEFGSACVNDSDTPVTLLSLDPHMHSMGSRITTVVERGSGAAESVLDEPFQFDDRDSYLLSPPVVIEPGESIRTTCTFDNPTSDNVSFGQSAVQEMCFQFAIAYPLLALDNGVQSLIGATNTCW